MRQVPVPPVENALFLNGGRACLSVIANYLKSHNCKKVLLPAYLCPTILDVMDKHSIDYSFYEINDDLTINLDDLRQKAVSHEVIYSINYFGFQYSAETLSELRHLQSKGMLLIEDNAQAGFPTKCIGDFWFNSMRKFSAVDGGYLATRINPLPPFSSSADIQNHRLPLIREYRRKLRTYLFEGRGKREELERLFYQAESYYEQDGVILGDITERKKIESQDWQAIKDVRRENYLYLLNQIIDLRGVYPIFPTLQPDIMPMGLPVYISEFSRDKLIELLADVSISLTVHWDALLSDPRTRNNPKITKMAGSILTLPVDQYTNKSQLNYLTDHLARILTRCATN